MKLAIQNVLVPGDTLTEQFTNAARYGFDAVEIFVAPTFDLAARIGEIQEAMTGSGLPVAALCTNAGHDPLVPDPAERARRFATLGALLQLTDQLGARGIVSVPSRPPRAFPNLTDPERELMELAVAEIGGWAATLPLGNAALFLEPLNRYEASFLNRVDQAVALSERIDHPRVLALADLFHMNIEEADMVAPLHAAGPRLGHVHIADNNRLQPGAGCLDFQTPFAALKAIDYDGYVSLECFAAGGPRIAGDPTVALPACVQFLRDRWAAA